MAKPVWTAFADAAHRARVMGERQVLFVIQFKGNAAAQKVCHHVLMPQEEISVILKVTHADAQHMLQLAMEVIIVLWDLALVIIFPKTIEEYYIIDIISYMSISCCYDFIFYFSFRTYHLKQLKRGFKVSKRSIANAFYMYSKLISFK